MKFKSLTACSAVALMAATMADHAQAISITDIPSASIFMAGPPLSLPLFDSIAAQLLEPGFLTIYDEGSPALSGNDGQNYHAYLGIIQLDPLNLSPTTYSNLAGQEVLIEVRATGGSVFGVIPVGTSTGIANVPVNTSNCTQNTTTTSGTYQYACLATGDDTNGNSNPHNRVPDFGISEVEPDIFEAPYNTPSSGVASTPLTSTQLSSLNINVLDATTQAIALTNTIPTGTPLASSAVAGVLTGSLVTWSQVNSALSTLPNQTVVVCRSLQGSGTQAVFNNWFMHFPCEAQGGQLPLSNVPPAVAADSYSIIFGTATGSGTLASPYVVNASDGYTVAEASGDAEVRACLSAAQNGGVWPSSTTSQQAGDGNYYQVNFGSGGYGAIGELAGFNVDSLPPIASSSPGWYLNALDGYSYAATTAKNTWYPLMTESTLQYLKTYPSGIALSLIKALIYVTQYSPDLASLEDLGVQQSVLGLPTKASNSTTSANVTMGTKGGKTCEPWVKQY